MRIAQVDTVFGVGSTGKIVKDIHDRLLSSGHDSRVYYGRGPVPGDNRVVKISSGAEVILDVASSRMTGYTGAFSPFATKKVIEELELFKPDVVHLHELHGYYVNYFKLVEYLISRKIPVAWTLHCEYVYTGRCGSAFDCRQWESHCVKCPSLKNYPKSILFDRSEAQFARKKALFSNLEKIIFVPVSSWLSRRFDKSFLRDKLSTVVHNGIDTAHKFIFRDYAQLLDAHGIKGGKVVLSVAPDIMSEQKGGGWIFEIAKRLSEVSVTFVLIGVKKMPANLPGNVICIPVIEDQVLLSRYYSMADIFLITSGQETFSLTCAESLACGTPIIGFDSGGPSEVAPNPYGHFAPYGCIDELTSLLRAALNGEVLMASRGECIEYAKNRYSNDRMFQDYLSIYRALLKQ